MINKKSGIKKKTKFMPISHNLRLVNDNNNYF